MYEKMFEPIKIRGMELKNRVIFPATGTKFSFLFQRMNIFRG